METLLIVVIVLGGSLGVVVVLAISSILSIQSKYRELKAQRDEEEELDSKPAVVASSNYTSHPIYLVKPPRVECDMQSYHRLEEMFIRDPGGTTLITEAFHPHSMDEVSQSLVVLFEANDQAVSLVKSFIDLEMSKALEGEGPTTLFRRDSVASKVMRFYTKLIGQQYLISVLWPNIRHVCLADEFIEIDRNKMRKEDDLEEHLTNFQEVLADFLEAIINSVSLCPPQLRTICYHLNTKAAQYFPDNNMKVVSGFIFLRFFTPAIICPTAYGIVEGDLTPNQSRTLLLVAKVLQNMANGVLFGAKEQFMMPLNEFLIANTNLVKDFLAELAAPTNTGTGMKAFSVSTNSKFTALRVLHTNLVRGFPKFKRDNFPEMYDKAQLLVRELADDGKQLTAKPSMSQRSLRRVSVSLLKGFDPNTVGNIGYDPSQNLSLRSITITPSSLAMSTTYSNLQPIGHPPIESEIIDTAKKEPEPEPAEEQSAENEESDETIESDEENGEEPTLVMDGENSELVRSSSTILSTPVVDSVSPSSSPAGLLTKSRSGASLHKSRSGSNIAAASPPLITKKKANKNIPNERLYRPSSTSKLQNNASASSPSSPPSPHSARSNKMARASSSTPSSPKTAKRDFSPGRSRPTVDANVMQPATKLSPKISRQPSTRSESLSSTPPPVLASSAPVSTSPPSSHRSNNSETSAWS